MKNIAIVLVSVLIMSLTTSCTNTKSSNEQTKEASVTSAKGYELSFHAIGNEPSWNVKVSDNQITYTSMNLPDKLNFTDVKMNRIMDVAGLAYSGKNDQGQSIHVQILKDKCSDTMSEKEWPFSVSVNLVLGAETEKLNGCGEYLLDERLAEKWYLKELEGKAVIAKNPEKRPMIQFYVEKHRIQANMGCNGIGGAFEVMENTIYFDARFMSTQMYCEEVMELENKFTKLFMGKFLKYHFDGDSLVFTSFSDEVIAVFGK